MKIAIEIKADGNFCGECRFITRTLFDTPWCHLFDARLFKIITGQKKRCRQCIEATIESDGE